MERTVFPYALVTKDPTLIVQIGSLSRDGTYLSGQAPHDNLHTFWSDLPFQELYKQLNALKSANGEGFALIKIEESNYHATGNIASLFHRLT